ncbi:DUF2947 family protein [Lysobacter capsici]|uniref:DUF2947 family protein n=1 Tax=Lysobacter capsici TaxID=435897 RepID=UPI000448DDF5|nr:DUF2947 family protein [Lysobacter capsici]
MIPIYDSPLKKYLDDFSSAELASVFLLEGDEAVAVWREYIGDGKSFNHLSNESWVVGGSWVTIGDWMDGYPRPLNSQRVAELVSTKSEWSDNEELFLIQNSKNIIKFTMKDFNKFWNDFLSIFGDGPVLISRDRKSGVAFQFLPLGYVQCLKAPFL